jgi:hypothetical protein
VTQCVECMCTSATTVCSYVLSVCLHKQAQHAADKHPLPHTKLTHYDAASDVANAVTQMYRVPVFGVIAHQTEPETEPETEHLRTSAAAALPM